MKRIELVCATLLFLISGPVLFSIEEIVHLRMWKTMQPNVALAAFFICLAFVFSLIDSKKPAQFIGVFIAIVGTLTLFEHVFKFDFKIDTVFSSSALPVYGEHPGRMALNSSVALLLIGLSIIFANFRQQRRLHLIASGLCGGMTLALGMTTLIGSFLNFGPGVDFASFTHMALASALAFTIAGFGTTFSSLSKILKDRESSFCAFPVVATLSLIFIVFLGWQLSIKNEEAVLRKQLAREAGAISQQLYEKLNQTTLAMKRFASRAEHIGLKNTKYLELDTKNYIEHIPIIDQISLTDANLSVTWSYPKIFPLAPTPSQANSDKTKTALEVVKNSHVGTLSDPFQQPSGAVASLLPVGLYIKNKFAGAVFATISIDELFSKVVDREKFAITVIKNKNIIYKNTSGLILQKNENIEVYFNYGQANFDIVFAPSQKYVSAQLSQLPHLVLLVGLLMSMIGGLVIYFFSKNHWEKQIFAQREKSIFLERVRDHEWRQAILNSAEYGMIATDGNGIIQTFNQAAERMLGYSANEVVGIHEPGLFHEASEIENRAQELSAELDRIIPAGFETLVAKTAANRQHDINEWCYLRKNGTCFPVSLSVTALRDGNDNIFGYLGVIIDLSEQKIAQREFLKTHERLQRVIEATGEGIWEYDLESKEILYIDNQCREIFGFRKDELLTFQDIADLIVIEDLESLSEHLTKHLEDRAESFEVEFRIKDRLKGSGEKWVHCMGRVTATGGERARLVSTVRDATGAVQARLQLETALKDATVATDAKSAFLANMSHEIRTPLNGIIGIMDLLLETKLNSKQQGFAQIVHQSGVSLLRLLTDILDFSKIEAGRLDLENSLFEIAPLVEVQIDILISKANEKNLTLGSFISRQLPGIVVGDAGHIAQVLLNLLGNAIKFTENGGVTLIVDKVETSQGEIISFKINDTGIGLDGPQIEKLFKPFTQVDASISNKYGGTGLGLSICKKLVEKMGGEIGVQSELGVGTTFWFNIPLQSPELSSEPYNLKDWENLIGLKFLLIEQNLISQLLLKNYIVSSKMQMDCVQNLNGAKELLNKNQMDGFIAPYQIIFISNAKNGLTAFDTLSELKVSLGSSLPKFVYVAEFDDISKESDILAQGFSFIISKPIKQSVLLDAIVSAMHDQSMPVLKTVSISEPKADLQKDLSHLRILVADDVAVNQILTQNILDFLGYSSTVVANGTEVLEALELAEYDLILMDCRMPEMDGFEATRQIRALTTPMRKIPILALTANAMREDEIKCLAAGMDDYMSKPIKKEFLAEKLEKWLSTKIRKQAS